jgi:hypothetical protein
VLATDGVDFEAEDLTSEAIIQKVLDTIPVP